MKEHCVDLKIAKKLKENGFLQKSKFNYINSSYSTGFEGENIYWLCDNKWELYDIEPNAEYDDTGIITKEDGLVPDFTKICDYKKYKKFTSEKINKLLVYSAPFSDELLKELPGQIKDSDFDYYYHLNIERSSIYNEMYFISYGITNQNRAWMKYYNTDDKKLSKAIGKMWLLLKKEGYIK